MAVKLSMHTIQMNISTLYLRIQDEVQYFNNLCKIFQLDMQKQMTNELERAFSKQMNIILLRRKTLKDILSSKLVSSFIRKQCIHDIPWSFKTFDSPSENFRSRPHPKMLLTL